MEVLCGSQKQAKMRDISAVFSTTRQGSLCGDEMRGYHREDGPSMPNCINNVLIERGVKLVPWNCTRKESRLLLANAFRGTRLEQWMKEMNPVSRKKSYLLFKLSRSNSKIILIFRKLSSLVLWPLDEPQQAMSSVANGGECVQI